MSIRKIFGINPVLEALRAGRPIQRLMIARERRADRQIAQIVQLAQKGNIEVRAADREELNRITGGALHQGVVAVGAEVGYAALDDILRIPSERGEPGLILVLDGVEDPRNLGAVIRTAEAAGVHGVIIPERRSAGLTEAAFKAAAGALEYVPVARVTNIARTLDSLKQAGFWIAGAEAGEGGFYWEADFTGHTAIVMGGEGRGTRRLVLEKCDFIISLPLMGRISSLNVSAAAAIILYEVLRQRLGRGDRAGEKRV